MPEGDIYSLLTGHIGQVVGIHHESFTQQRHSTSLKIETHEHDEIHQQISQYNAYSFLYTTDTYLTALLG